MVTKKAGTNSVAGKDADAVGTAPPGKIETSKTLSPFNPAALRVGAAGRRDAGIETTLLELDCVKPRPQQWVRTNPALSIQVALLELKEAKEFYLVAPEVEIPSEIADSVKYYRLALTTTRDGLRTFWPAKLPGYAASGESWSRTGLKAQEMAAGEWVNVKANMANGVYDVRVAKPGLPEPVWPKVELEEALQLCFSSRFIRTPDHQVVRMLLFGEG